MGKGQALRRAQTNLYGVYGGPDLNWRKTSNPFVAASNRGQRVTFHTVEGCAKFLADWRTERIRRKKQQDDFLLD